MADEWLKNIKWLGHDGFAITEQGVTVVIDPFKAESAPPADIILVTHAHYDHCSVDDIARLVKPSTVIVTEPESAAKLAEAKIPAEVRTLAPGERTTVSDIAIEAVPAYNVNKQFHPREKNWLGFIVTIGGRRIYHAGDTDLIPEMAGLKVDVALLPVSGTYVMTADEAVAAAKRIRPGTAVPMHYNAIVGSDADADAFRKGLEGECEVVVLPPA